MANLFHKIKSRAKRITNSLEKAQEAITFAEAGHPQGTDAAPRPDSLTGGKLLVIGRETTFSQAVVDYALEMARRMSYEIVALNTAPLSCDTYRLFSASQKKICQEFQAMSVEQADKFRTAAEVQGLSFTHVVKFSDHDRALEDVQREHSNIEFVISDTDPDTVAERIADTPRPSNQVYVYSMI